MSRKAKRISTKIIPTVLMLAMPLVAFAQNVESGLSSIGGVFPHSGIAGATTVTGLIAIIIRWMLILAGAIAVLFVVIGGYQYLTSGGNEESAEKGKKTIINSLIGIVIVILAWVIVSVIVNLVSGNGLGFGGLF